MRILCSVIMATAFLSGCSASSYDGSSYSSQPTFTPLPSQDLGSDGVLPPSDSYEDVGTNAFVMADHDPFSTFAADVDTASYDIFRRDMQNSGRLPASSSVRLEEYINYFDYDYLAPAPGSDHPFAISLDAASSLFDRPSTLLRVGIQAELLPEEERKPANLVYLIDVSGSMQSAYRLPLVKALLKESLELLEDDDTVALVVYASGVGVRLAPTPISEKSKIIDAIDSLRAGGSTNGAGGIQLAYEQAVIGYLDNGINHVVLCTDGDFNVGAKSDEALVELIEEKRQTGVTFTALGFGSGNLNDAMMEKTSNAGNGVYGVITSPDDAIDYAQTRLLSNIYFVAKDVKIQVEFNRDVVAAYRSLGYENRAIADEDFTDDKVDAGEVGYGHSVTALYEVVFTEEDIPRPEGAPEVEGGPSFDGERSIADSSFVKVRVRYKDLEATEQDAAYELSATLENSIDSINAADSDFQWAAATAAFAELMKGSPYADESLWDTIEQLLASNTQESHERVIFAELVSEARVLAQP